MGKKRDRSRELPQGERRRPTPAPPPRHAGADPTAPGGADTDDGYAEQGMLADGTRRARGKRI